MGLWSLTQHYIFVIKESAAERHWVIEVLDQFYYDNVVVQSLTRIRLFATPWTGVYQGSVFFTISQSLLKLMSTESVMPPNHPSHPLSPSSPFAFNLFQHQSESFPSQLFALGGQNIGASPSVLPMNIQGWFPLGLTVLISLLSKGLSGVLQHHSLKASVLWCSAFFMVQLSHP